MSLALCVLCFAASVGDSHDGIRETHAVRATAYALLMESGYTVNHERPACYCLALITGPLTDPTVTDPSPAAFPEADAQEPPMKPVSQCPEGAMVLYTARVEWLGEARASVEAGLLRIQSRRYRTWKEKPDKRRIIVERQGNRGWIAIEWSAEEPR